MAYVYIIYSEKVDKFYIGSCLDFDTRIKQHNTHHFSTSFTSISDDWIEFYTVEVMDLTTARKIEKHLKQMKSRIYLKNLKKYPEIMEKLIKRYG